MSSDRGLPPPDFGLRLSSRVHACDGGRTLMGGGRVVRLSAPAATLVEGLPGRVGPDPAASRLARLLLDLGVADPWWEEPAGADVAVDDVTVVVPTQDRAAGVAQLLASLPSAVPVIVVDDGSADPAALELVCRRYGARVVRHGHNRGPAAARNTGLRAVQTPYVAFCDSDVVPQPGWLATLRRHLDDPSVALVGPRVLGRAATPGDGWLDRYEQARSSLDLGPLPARVALHGEVSYLPSAVLVARAAALGDGFDESMRCGEDVDLVWRLLSHEWGVRYEPAAVVRHDHRTSLGAWLGRKAFYGTSAAPLAARHPGAVAPVVATPWTATVTVALLAQRRWSVPVAGVALALVTCSTARRLKSSNRPTRAAAVLVLEGTVAAGWQGASALIRHYWPVVALASVRSGRVRRAVLVAGVVEGVLDWRRVQPELDLPRYVVAHRLDDLAYGAGLWLGAVRARSARSLMPLFKGWRPRSVR
ncbi:mycofactocin biosynthesis glycosyltransferase MftF [Nocardioides sp.]|uniref:mycofactocin biosynthesis glycosyltransferase MftF n=1 Tax=Nocardioides sp. TaxID=35761 RepID=UPI0027325068|nr:mycofactocin biosynthesis glycosyltransferase MftF [Nocardioides sp.]MDP3894464.1 mycofactocin biosynthesis glycosyltransferase MftF [Nocardioides sp.]